MEVKIYRVFINDEDETGLFGISLVNKPANQAEVIYMSENPIQDIRLNEDKRLVSGVVLRPGQLIKRFNQDTNEPEYWYFEAEDIRKMVEFFFGKSYNNNVNIEHQIYNINDVVLTESYFIDRKRGIDPMEFKQYEDFSWIVTYKVGNDDVWNEIKNGTFKGFSIDGRIEKLLVKTEIKMSEKESKIDVINRLLKEYDKIKDEDNNEIEISIIDYVNYYVK